LLISKHQLPTSPPKAVAKASTADIPKPTGGVDTPKHAEQKPTPPPDLTQKPAPSITLKEALPGYDEVTTFPSQSSSKGTFPPNPGQGSSKGSTPAGTEDKPTTSIAQLARKASFQKPKDSLNEPPVSPLPQKATPTHTPTPSISSGGQPPKSTFGAVARMNEAAARRCQKVEWMFESEGQGQFITWRAKLTLRGSIIAEGAGQSKQIAKEFAAQQALDTMGWK